MSPSTALHDPVFLTYLCLLAFVIVATGLLLTLLRLILRRDLTEVWKTYCSWLLLAPLAALAVFAGRVPFIIGVTLCGVFGFREFAGVSGLSSDRLMTRTVYLGIAAIGSSLLLDSRYRFSAASGALCFILVVTICCILIVPILRDRFEGQTRHISLGIIGFVYLGWMFGHLGMLANSTHAYGYICYVIFATEVSDIAAFTFGKMLGRHPLRRNISPGKTWEGALGALAVSMVLPWLLRFSLPSFGTMQLVLAGLIIGVGGQLGDLSVSVIKRDIGAKDMSALIPGHGGILDRIDSLIYVAPLFMHMTSYFELQ